MPNMPDKNKYSVYFHHLTYYVVTSNGVASNRSVPASKQV